MKRIVMVWMWCGLFLLGSSMAQAETPQEQAARRLPPVLYALDLPATLLSGQTYTLNWSLLGYQGGYHSKVVFFNCAGVTAGACGSDATTGFANSGDLTPTSSEAGPWDYNGVVATVSHYTATFTAPTVTGDTDLVLRFFQVNGTDTAAGQGSLSLLAPGGLANVGYYDASGRRLVAKVYDPAGFANDGSPRVSTIAAQTTDANTASSLIAFSIADLESDAAALQISVSSSNTALVDPAQVSLTGSGQNRSLRILPTTGQAGTANVTVTVSDGTHSTVKTFTLTVGSALSIANTSVTEGDSGSTNAQFTVSLDHASSQTITVNYATSATGGATANVDYTTTSGTLTIPAGQTSGTISVSVLGDFLAEANEVFRVTLSNPVHASIQKATGDATIIDNDPDPTVVFTSASQSANEGSLVVATVQLSNVSSFDVSIPFTTTGTATPDLDYSSLSASPLTIPAGSTTANITFVFAADEVTDDDKTVILTLENPTYASKGTTDIHTVNRIGNIRVTASSNGQATLAWDPVTGAAAYNLYFATQSGVTKDNYASLPGGMMNQAVTSPYTQTGLTNGIPYYMIMSAVSAGGEVLSASGTTTPVAERFVDNHNGTVTDTVNNLILLKNPGCFSSMSWDSAMATAANLQNGQCGLTDGSTAGQWRLPTHSSEAVNIDGELAVLYAAKDSSAFTGVQANNFYWSSTSGPYSTSNAYGVILRSDNTSVHGYYKTYNGNYAWPVRQP